MSISSQSPQVGSSHFGSAHVDSAARPTWVALVAAALVGLSAACGPADSGIWDSVQAPADQASQAADLAQPPAEGDTGADANLSPAEGMPGDFSPDIGGPSHNPSAVNPPGDVGVVGDAGDLGGADDFNSAIEQASATGGGAGGDAGAASAGSSPSISSEGGLDGQFTELNWDELYELDLETGEPSPLLAGLDGQPVKIPGFMVPLDDSASTVREFLLVPFAGACIHVPPPPPNQIVHVTMVDGETSEVYWWDPIWIYGNLKIENVEHAYGQASFRMGGLRTEVYTVEP